MTKSRQPFVRSMTFKAFVEALEVLPREKRQAIFRAVPFDTFRGLSISGPMAWSRMESLAALADVAHRELGPDGFRRFWLRGTERSLRAPPMIDAVQRAMHLFRGATKPVLESAPYFLDLVSHRSGKLTVIDGDRPDCSVLRMSGVPDLFVQSEGYREGWRHAFNFILSVCDAHGNVRVEVDASLGQLDYICNWSELKRGPK